MVQHRSWKSRRSDRFGVVLLGLSVIAAPALALAGPASAAKITGPPPPVRRYLPGLRIGPHLSVLPAAARGAVAVTKSRELFGVFCNSPADCWAVGEISTKNVTVNQVLHWTGKKWFPVAVPNQAGTHKGASNELFAVRCTSKVNCWAAGDSQRRSDAILDQLLHFNGSKWSLVSAPAPGGTAAGDINNLNDVACTSAISCWAVGDYGIQGMSVNPEVLFNQTLHWDGKKWTFVKPPNPAGNSTGDANALDSVRCTAPTDCWAGGTAGTLTKSFKLRNQMLHWTGKKWAKVTVPSPVTKGKAFINGINTLACTATANCWAVGVAAKFLGKGFEHNEALHWTGKRWTLVKTPNPGGSGISELFGVTCTAPGNCWAVGTAGNQPSLNQALHWNSKHWSVVHTPNGGGTGNDDTNTLDSVRCTSASNCWSVGDANVGNNVIVNQILHWNGSKWQDS
jgi:hypothetical protein